MLNLSQKLLPPCSHPISKGVEIIIGEISGISGNGFHQYINCYTYCITCGKILIWGIKNVAR
jgi:hypothetical protein